MRISFLAMEKIAKMAAQFNMAAKKDVTPQNSRLGTPNLNFGPKGQNGCQILGYQKWLLPQNMIPC